MEEMTAENDNDELSIGFLSSAHVHAEAYAKIVAAESDVELVGIADDVVERGQDFAEQHETQYRDRDDLLKATDAVIVCSENTAHADWIKSAAAADVDVLCEKPLAPTASEATEIVETCERAGIVLGVAMPLRFSEPALEAKNACETGRVGSIEYLVGTNRGQMPGGWFADPNAAGGGAAIDHTVHIVDLVHWLTGERVAEVHAELGTRFHDIAAEDVNVLSMELTDGTVFTLDGSWSRPDEWDFWGDATIDIIGSEGTIDVNCFDQTYKLTRNTSDNSGISSVYWGTDPNRGLIRDFVKEVRSDGTPEISGRNGVDAVAVVDAVYESAERGAPVCVEYPEIGSEHA
jgi:UDP-N-acetylglucosamine 3-dehydrogenase